MTSRAIFDLAKPVVDTAAAAASDRRALIVLYLGGGIDPHNFVAPYAGANRTAYEAARPDVDIAQNPSTRIGTTNWQLHPAFFNASSASNVMDIFAANKAAILMNTGPLTRPTNRSNYSSGTLPRQLYSHSDQSNVWQTGYPANPAAPTGFLGRLVEMIAPSYNPSTTYPSMFTFAGKGLFSGTFNQRTAGLGQNGLDSRGTAGATKTAVDALRFPDPATLTNPLMKQVAQAQADSEALTAQATAAINAATLGTTFYSDTISNQLRTALRLIKRMESLNQRRQVHWITQGGFDQHADLLTALAERLGGTPGNLAKPAGTARYIKQVYDEITRTDFTDTGNNPIKVTLLIYSEFGRTLTQNGNGTDHAWGGHAMLIGPDVLGTNGISGSPLFGIEPTIDITGSQWVNDSRGLMIPTTPNDSLYMTVSKWMGVPDASAGGYNALDLVCPNYVAGGFTNSGATARDLGMLA